MRQFFGPPGWLRLSCLLTLGLLCGVPLQGAVYLISDTNDTTGPKCLRGAIIESNRRGGDNTIVLYGIKSHPTVFHLTVPGADEDEARNGDLDITRGNLTIIGAGANITIDATGLGDRVFQVFTNAHLTLANLTITGGTAPNGKFFVAPRPYYLKYTAGESGGAIYNAGTLILNNCEIVGNVGGNSQQEFIEDSEIDFATASGDGGGIYNSGSLTMSGCRVEENAAGGGTNAVAGGNGGGIANDGSCRLTDCVLTKNQGGAGGILMVNNYLIGNGGDGGNGGGIFNSGTINVDACVVSTNQAGNGGDAGFSELQFAYAPGGTGGNGGDGAGIYNVGHMNLYFSTVSDNATGSGGNGGPGAGWGGNAGTGGNGAGVFNTGDLRVENSTISRNNCGYGGNGTDGSGAGGGTGGSGGSGGGIYNSGAASVISGTIVLNATGSGGDAGNGLANYGESAPDPAGGHGGDGGGILNVGGITNMVFGNTLVALNVTASGGQNGVNADDGGITVPLGANAAGSGPGLAGDFTSQGFNLIGAADGSTGVTNGVQSDQAGSIAEPINPLIGPLQMNGGPTPTHALLPGSPAINQGDSFGADTDQRGDRRPFLYPGIPNAHGGDGSDIGAFELQ